MPWFDGTLYAETTVPFDCTDRGLLLGDGVFDTALVLGGAMVWREAHLARLAAGCQTLEDLVTVNAAIVTDGELG